MLQPIRTRVCSPVLKMVLPSDLGYSGRRVFVAEDQLGEAFRRLQNRLKRNRVVQEVSRQKRHEKKGVKRRRLSSERWRRVFANEVFIFSPLSYTCAHPRTGAEESAARQHYPSSWSLLNHRVHHSFVYHAAIVPGIFLLRHVPRGRWFAYLHTSAHMSLVLQIMILFFHEAGPEPMFGAWLFGEVPTSHALRYYDFLGLELSI